MLMVQVLKKHGGRGFSRDIKLYSFEVRPECVKKVRMEAKEAGKPILEEYDFRKDDFNGKLRIYLKPAVKIRPYQELALSKMFTGGRARSGMIVLPWVPARLSSGLLPHRPSKSRASAW